MKNVVVAIAAVLLTGAVSAAGVHLAAQETAKTDSPGLPVESVQLTTAPSATEQKDYADNVLILMKADTCTEAQLKAVLEKYHLTVLQEGSVIPFCTVQLETPLEKTELEALAEAIAKEDGILSASLDYITQLDPNPQPVTEETEQKDYADNVLILMKADTCTEAQLKAVLEKYHLTVLQEGSVIPFCTVQLEAPLEKTELEALAEAIAKEDGILSASLDYITQLDPNPQPVTEETEQKDYADNVLILMKADTCTEAQLKAVLEKYHLTVLQEGSVIPFCTVQLEAPLEKTELEALAETIAKEDGILSAMLDSIMQLD